MTGKEAGKLFHNACCEDLVFGETLWQIILGSNKCTFGKEKLALKEARERDIAKCLKVHDNMSHPVGKTLPMEQRACI